MLIAVSITILSIPLLAASVAGLGLVAATSIVRSRRNLERLEQEFRLYDRAFEIYSRLSSTAEARAQLMISDELIIVAALHACGSLNDPEYREAKARIISRDRARPTATGIRCQHDTSSRAADRARPDSEPILTLVGSRNRA